MLNVRGNPSNDTSGEVRSEMWAVLNHFKLVIFVLLKLNCNHFSKAKQTIKARFFSRLPNQSLAYLKTYVTIDGLL